MPAIDDSLFYVDKDDNARAKTLIMKGTNFGPLYMKLRKAGDHTDYTATRLGKYIQNSRRANLEIKHIQYKFYAIAKKTIKKNAKLTADYTDSPWRGVLSILLKTRGKII